MMFDKVKESYTDRREITKINSVIILFPESHRYDRHGITTIYLVSYSYFSFVDSVVKSEFWDIASDIDDGYYMYDLSQYIKSCIRASDRDNKIKEVLNGN